MNSEIQKYILNFFIKMPLNRKKEREKIYIYNPINEGFFKKLICCFPQCNYSKSNLKITNDCILNSLDYFDLIILFNIDFSIENKIKNYFDILSEKGELWIICFPISEVEKRMNKNIFDFSEKMPEIKNKNDEIMKETLEVVEMILFPTKSEPPISPKSKSLLNLQIDKVESMLENLDITKYSKSSSFINNKIKFYTIKTKKPLLLSN
tara:strand:- start:25346 stop:25969 length:624 start_codon:yes stop_codon:yes gene_type:complete